GKRHRGRQILYAQGRYRRCHRSLRRCRAGETGLCHTVPVFRRSLRKKREEKTCGEGLPALPRPLSSRRRRRQGPQENRKTKSRNRQRKEAVAFAPHCPSKASMFSSSGCLYL